jgi:hypothetical protein
VSRLTALASAIAAVALLATLAASSVSSYATDKASTGRCPNRRPPATSVTGMQATQLDVLRRSTFNNMDGKQVTHDLLNHRLLWCAAVLDRLGDDALIKLRDLDQNLWNADTVYVLSSGADDRALAQVARRWHADAIQWVGGATASQLLGDSGRWRILEVWWD